MSFLVVAVTSCRAAPVPANLAAFHSPGAIVAHPGGRYLYVVNENYDLRDASGSVSVIDMQAVDASAGDALQAKAIVADAGVRVDSLAGIPAFDRDQSRLYLPTRDEGRIFALQAGADGGTLACERHSANDLCTGVFDSTQNDANPYAAVIMPTPDGKKRLIVSHLGNDGEGFTQHDVTGGVIAGPVPFLYSFQGQSTSMVVAGPTGSPLLFSVDAFFDVSVFLHPDDYSSGAQASQSAARATAVSPDGGRVFAVSDSGIDLVLAVPDPAHPLASTSYDAQAGTALYLSRASYGLDDLLFVTGWSDDSLNIYNVTGLGLEARIEHIGHAPFGLATVNGASGPLVAVSLFNDDEVVIVDASSADATAHHVVARIGAAR